MALLDRLTWRQFQWWGEYERVEPFPPDRAELSAAIIAMTVANVNIVDKHKQLPPARFMARRWYDPTYEAEIKDGSDKDDAGVSGAAKLKKELEARARPSRPVKPPTPANPVS